MSHPTVNPNIPLGDGGRSWTPGTVSITKPCLDEGDTGSLAGAAYKLRKSKEAVWKLTI